MTDSSAPETGQIETRAEAQAFQGGESKYWQNQLSLAESDHRDWIKDGKDVIQRYKGKQRGLSKSGSKRFNILFSNTEVLKSALFARMAKPDVRRRFADQDPIGRQIAEIIERSLVYCNDSYDAEGAFGAAIEDNLLPGRGVVRVCYEAETSDKDGKEYVASQELYAEYVPWDDFRHEPAKQWKDVSWIAFRHRMNRSALRSNEFKSPNDIPLNWTPKADDEKLPDAFKRAEVWEIWDKETKSRIWIVNGHQEVLRKDQDPFGLADFWPIAEPLQAVTGNDTLIPVPEFHLYQDQADGLDEIEARIDRLTRALKRRGVYDATIQELKRLAKAADNEFIPVKNYAELSTKGGLAAAFQTEDLKVLAEVLQALHEQRDLRVQTIYEIIGIADIMRGSTDPRETLGAQKIKAQFGGNRLKKRQDLVQKWIRDTLRLKAEIIAEHFEPQKLAEMTGFPWQPVPPQQSMPMSSPMGSMPPGMPGAQAGQAPPLAAAPPNQNVITPEMIQTLRSDRLRSYRIDVETDSTVFEDAEAEKAGRVELLKAMTEYVVGWAPIAAANPALMPLAMEGLAFGVRGFKAGRQMEEVIEQTKIQMEEASKQPPKPSPEEQKAQADKEAMAAKLQMDQQKQQGDLAAQQAKLEMEAQANAQKLQFERQKHEQEMAMRAQEHQAELVIREREMQMKQADAELNRAATAEQHHQSMTLERERADNDHQLAREKMADDRAAAGLKARQTESGEQESVSAEDVRSEQTNNVMKEVAEALSALGSGFQELSRASMAKRRIVRGADGRATHTEAV